MTSPEPNNLFDDYTSKGEAAHKQKLDIATSMNLDSDLKATGEKYANDPRFKDRFEWLAKNKPEGKELTKWKYQTYMKDYLRCIWSVDESVGMIMETLKEPLVHSNQYICQVI